ncbi:MAG: hypothetical protein AVDCRST_MAG50-1819, partial [uncultured Acidimicrobiales bacterium]
VDRHRVPERRPGRRQLAPGRHPRDGGRHDRALAHHLEGVRDPAVGRSRAGGLLRPVRHLPDPRLQRKRRRQRRAPHRADRCPPRPPRLHAGGGAGPPQPAPGAGRPEV